jgi:lipoprotein-releasing system ATP-binding protein
MSEVLIEARNVSRLLPGIVPVTLVQNIDLTIGSHEFVAVTGPSGSGKSSLMYLLGLLDLPTEGDVFIRGNSTSHMSEEERARVRLEELGFVFQFHFLLAEFTLTDNVAMPMRALGEHSPRQIRERAEGLLDSLGLADHRHKRPDQISGGQRQRVAVARALANEPAVILADEPTGNLDTKSSDQVFAILRDLVDQRGTTVVAVTHSEELAGRMDRHVHLVDGRIVSDNAKNKRIPAS